MTDDTKVYLECVKEGSRLRVKIRSPGYNNNANCQFPKNIRAEGRKYEVSPKAIKVSSNSGTFFYRISKSNIKILEDDDEVAYRPSTIYTSGDCCICIDSECEIVIVECGHLCLCQDCSKNYKSDTCPLCRGHIKAKIHKNQLQ